MIEYFRRYLTLFHDCVDVEKQSFWDGVGRGLIAVGTSLYFSPIVRSECLILILCPFLAFLVTHWMSQGRKFLFS